MQSCIDILFVTMVATNSVARKWHLIQQSAHQRSSASFDSEFQDHQAELCAVCWTSLGSPLARQLGQNVRHRAAHLLCQIDRTIG